jgi:hypothetical protein
MWNRARCTFALLIGSFALAHGASAVMEEDEGDESEFVRTGFYLGIGGTAAFPENWNNDLDGQLDEQATDLANQNAQQALDAIDPPTDLILPLAVTVDGGDLEDTQFGVNGVIGYRAGPLAAFELEGEWLLSSNKTNLGIDALSGSDPDLPIRQSSTGFHTAETQKIWTITASVKAYPPFTGWLRRFARFQPFAKVGLGVQHSQLDTEIVTSGLSTTNTDETIVVPANFRIRTTKTNLDGALRVGGGIEIYATRNIVSELNASYVVPFSEVGPLNADYVSVQWRLVYRF